MAAKKRRKVILSVDFTVMLDADVATDEVGFDIPKDVEQRIMPVNCFTNKVVGRVTGYCTQDNPE